MKRPAKPRATTAWGIYCADGHGELVTGTQSIFADRADALRKALVFDEGCVDGPHRVVRVRVVPEKARKR